MTGPVAGTGETMQRPAVLIYGANGSSGRQILSMLSMNSGLPLVVGGRDHGAVIALGRRLGFEARVFDLKDERRIREMLQGIGLLLNCAGPYAMTCRPLLTACAAAGVHYCDLSGEIEAVRYVFQNHEKWVAAGIRAVPAIGFTSLATEVLIARGRRRFPGATAAELYLRPAGIKLSPGTAASLLEVMRQGSMAREDGRLVSVDFGSGTRLSPFRRSGEISISMPTADLITAWIACKLPRLRSFWVLPLWQARLLRYLQHVPFILWPPLRGLMSGVLRIVAAQGIWSRPRDVKQPHMDILVELNRLPQPGRYVARARTRDPYQFTYQVIGGMVGKIAFGDTPFPSGAMPPSALMDDGAIAESGAWLDLQEEYDDGMPPEPGTQAEGS